VGFVVDKATLEQVFPEYFGFTLPIIPPISSTNFSIIHNHPGLSQ
jgi:hypothetical protein